MVRVVAAVMQWLSPDTATTANITIPIVIAAHCRHLQNPVPRHTAPQCLLSLSRPEISLHH